MEAILAQLLELNNSQRQFLIHFFRFCSRSPGGRQFKSVQCLFRADDAPIRSKKG
jgi:hypothetical protein